MLNRKENTNISPTFGKWDRVYYDYQRVSSNFYIKIDKMSDDSCGLSEGSRTINRSYVFFFDFPGNCNTNKSLDFPIVGEILALLYSEGISEFESSAPEAKSLYSS